MSIRVVLSAEIGQLTDIKCKKIAQSLGKEYPTSISMPNRLVITGTSAQIVIEPDNIQVLSLANTAENVQKVFAGLFDLLMIDKSETGSVICTEIINIGKDCMELSKENETKIFEDAIGVGKRIFFMYEDKLSEFRVEPYIEDKNNLYIEGQYNLSNININNLETVIESIKNDYNIKKEKVILK